MQMNYNDTNSNALPGIRCDVTNCVYNSHKDCTANHIDVGPQYASSAADTVCATFKAQQ